MTDATPKLEELTRRLEKLERQNRWLKRLGFAVVVLATAGLLAGGDDPPAKRSALESGKVVLVDAKGKARGWLHATEQAVALAYVDGDGRVRSGLVLTKEGGVLRYLGDGGKPVAGVSVEKNGVALGSRSRADGTEAGQNAILEILGRSLAEDAILSRPGK